MSALVASSFGGGHALPPRLAEAALSDSSVLLTQTIAHPLNHDDWLRTYLGSGCETYTNAYGADPLLVSQRHADAYSDAAASAYRHHGIGGGGTSSAAPSVSNVSTNHPLSSLRSLPDKMKVSVFNAYRHKRNGMPKWLPVVLNRLRAGGKWEGGGAAAANGGGSHSGNYYGNNEGSDLLAMSNRALSFGAGGGADSGAAASPPPLLQQLGLGGGALAVPMPTPFSSGSAGTAARCSFADLFVMGGGNPEGYPPRNNVDLDEEADEADADEELARFGHSNDLHARRMAALAADTARAKQSVVTAAHEKSASGGSGGGGGIPKPPILAPASATLLFKDCAAFSSLALLYAEMYYHEGEEEAEAEAGSIARSSRNNNNNNNGIHNGVAAIKQTSRYYWEDHQTVVLVTADAIYLLGGYGEAMVEPHEEEKLACEVAVKTSPAYIAKVQEKELARRRRSGLIGADHHDDSSSAADDDDEDEEVLYCFENRRFYEHYYIRRCVPIAAVTDFSQSSESNVVNVVCNNNITENPHHHLQNSSISSYHAFNGSHRPSIVGGAGDAVLSQTGSASLSPNYSTTHTASPPVSGGADSSATPAVAGGGVSQLTDPGRFFDLVIPAVSDPNNHQHTDIGQDEPGSEVFVADSNVLLEAIAGAKKIARWKTEVAKSYDEHAAVDSLLLEHGKNTAAKSSEEAMMRRLMMGSGGEEGEGDGEASTAVEAIITQFVSQSPALRRYGDALVKRLCSASSSSSNPLLLAGGVGGGNINGNTGGGGAPDSSSSSSPQLSQWEMTLRKAILFTHRLKTRLATTHCPVNNNASGGGGGGGGGVGQQQQHGYATILPSGGVSCSSVPVSQHSSNATASVAGGGGDKKGGGFGANASAADVLRVYTERMLRNSINGPNMADIPFRSAYHIESRKLLLPTPPTPCQPSSSGTSSAIFMSGAEFLPEPTIPIATLQDLACTAMAVKTARDYALTQLNLAVAAQSGLLNFSTAAAAAGTTNAIGNGSSTAAAKMSSISDDTLAAAFSEFEDLSSAIREVTLLRENMKRLEAENSAILATTTTNTAMSGSLGGVGGGDGSSSVKPRSRGQSVMNRSLEDGGGGNSSTTANNAKLSAELESAKKLVVELQRKLKLGERQLEQSKDEAAVLRKELDEAVKNIKMQNNGIRNFIENYPKFITEHWGQAIKSALEFRDGLSAMTRTTVSTYLATSSAVSGIVNVAYQQVHSAMTAAGGGEASSRSVSGGGGGRSASPASNGANAAALRLNVPHADVVAKAADELLTRILSDKESSAAFDDFLSGMNECLQVANTIAEEGAEMLLIQIKQKQVKVGGGGGGSETAATVLNVPSTSETSRTTAQHPFTRTRFKILAMKDIEMNRATNTNVEGSPLQPSSPTYPVTRSRGMSVYSNVSGSTANGSNAAGGGGGGGGVSNNTNNLASSTRMLATGIINFDEVSTDQALIELKDQYLVLKKSLAHATSLITDVNTMNREAPQKELLARSTIHIILQRISEINIRRSSFAKWIRWSQNQKISKMKNLILKLEQQLKDLNAQLEEESLHQSTRSNQTDEKVRLLERQIREKEAELRGALQRITDAETAEQATAERLTLQSNRDRARAEAAVAAEKKATERIIVIENESADLTGQVRQLERERDSLKSKIAKLEQMDLDRHANEAFEDQLKNLTLENEELRAQWQQEHNEFQKLKQEKESLFDVHSDLQREMAARSHVEARLGEQLRVMTADRDALSARITATSRDLEVSKQSLDLSTRKAFELEQQLGFSVNSLEDIKRRSLVERVDAIRLELDHNKLFMNLLKDEHDDFVYTILAPSYRSMNHILSTALRNRSVNDQISEARTRTMQEQFANVEGALSEAASRIDSLENQIDVQRRQFELELEDHKSRLRNSYAETEKLRVDCEVFERKAIALQKLADESEGLNANRIESQKKSLQALHAVELEVIEKQMHNQQLDVDRYKAETEETLADLDAALEREKQITSEFEHKSQELEAAFEVIKDLEKESESQSKTLADVTMKLNALQKSIADEYAKIDSDKAAMVAEVEVQRLAVEEERRRLVTRVFADAGTEIDEQIMDPESARYETRIIDLQDDIRGLTHDLHLSAARENVLFNENSTLKHDLAEAQIALDQAVEQMLEAEEDRSFMQVQIEKENIALEEMGEWAVMMRNFVFDRREKELLEESEGIKNLNAQLEEHIRGLVDETTLMTEDLMNTKTEHDADRERLSDATAKIAILEEKMIDFEATKTIAETVDALREQWLQEKIAHKQCQAEKMDVEEMLAAEKKDLGDRIMSLQEELIKLETEEDEGKSHLREELEMLRRQLASSTSQHQAQIALFTRDAEAAKKKNAKLSRASELMRAVLNDYEISEEEYAVEEDEEEISSGDEEEADEQQKEEDKKRRRRSSKRSGRSRRGGYNATRGGDEDDYSQSGSDDEDYDDDHDRSVSRTATNTTMMTSTTLEDQFYRTATDLTQTTNNDGDDRRRAAARNLVDRIIGNSSNINNRSSGTQYLRTKAKISLIEAKGKSHKFLRSTLLQIQLDRIVSWMRQWEESVFVGGSGSGGNNTNGDALSRLAAAHAQKRANDDNDVDFSNPSSETDDDEEPFEVKKNNNNRSSSLSPIRKQQHQQNASPPPLLFTYLSQRDDLIMSSCKALIQNAEESMLRKCLHREQSVLKLLMSNAAETFDLFVESHHDLSNVRDETIAIRHANEVATMATENLRLEEEISQLTAELMNTTDSHTHNAAQIHQKLISKTLKTIEDQSIKAKFDLAKEESDSRRLLQLWFHTASDTVHHQNQLQEGKNAEIFELQSMYEQLAMAYEELKIQHDENQQQLAEEQSRLRAISEENRQQRSVERRRRVEEEEERAADAAAAKAAAEREAAEAHQQKLLLAKEAEEERRRQQQAAEEEEEAEKLRLEQLQQEADRVRSREVLDLLRLKKQAEEEAAAAHHREMLAAAAAAAEEEAAEQNRLLLEEQIALREAAEAEVHRQQALINASLAITASHELSTISHNNNINSTNAMMTTTAVGIMGGGGSSMSPHRLTRLNSSIGGGDRYEDPAALGDPATFLFTPNPTGTLQRPQLQQLLLHMSNERGKAVRVSETAAHIGEAMRAVFKEAEAKRIYLASGSLHNNSSAMNINTMVPSSSYHRSGSAASAAAASNTLLPPNTAILASTVPPMITADGSSSASTAAAHLHLQQRPPLPTTSHGGGGGVINSSSSRTSSPAPFHRATSGMSATASAYGRLNSFNNNASNANYNANAVGSGGSASVIAPTVSAATPSAAAHLHALQQQHQLETVSASVAAYSRMNSTASLLNNNNNYNNYNSNASHHYHSQQHQQPLHRADSFTNGSGSNHNRAPSPEQLRLAHKIAEVVLMEQQQQQQQQQQLPPRAPASVSSSASVSIVGNNGGGGGSNRGGTRLNFL